MYDAIVLKVLWMDGGDDPMNLNNGESFKLTPMDRHPGNGRYLMERTSGRWEHGGEFAPPHLFTDTEGYRFVL